MSIIYSSQVDCCVATEQLCHHIGLQEKTTMTTTHTHNTAGSSSKSSTRLNFCSIIPHARTLLSDYFVTWTGLFALLSRNITSSCIVKSCICYSNRPLWTCATSALTCVFVILEMLFEKNNLNLGGFYFEIKRFLRMTNSLCAQWLVISSAQMRWTVSEWSVKYLWSQ